MLEPDSEVAHGMAASVATTIDGDPMGGLPRLSLRQLRLERVLAEWSPAGRLPPPLRWLEEWTGAAITVDRPEILWRASGLRRANLIAQFTAPRLGTHLALGIEIPLAHAMVDRLLGFDRRLGESRLAAHACGMGSLELLDPARARFARLETRADTETSRGPCSPGDLTIDRVGPDPFDPTGLGAIVTVRWPVRLGNVAAAVRLWIAESVVQLWLATPPGRPRLRSNRVLARKVSNRRSSRISTRPSAAGFRAPGAPGRFRGHAPRTETAAGRRRPTLDRLAVERLASQPERLGRPGPRPGRSGRPVPHSHLSGRRLGRPARSPRRSPAPRASRPRFRST